MNILFSVVSRCHYSAKVRAPRCRAVRSPSRCNAVCVLRLLHDMYCALNSDCARQVPAMFAAALSAALVPSLRVPPTVGPARARLTAVRCSEEPSNPPESPESPELTKIGSKAYYKGFLTQPVDETVTAERGDGTEQVLTLALTLSLSLASASASSSASPSPSASLSPSLSPSASP